jgi:hypothetical protein
LNCTAVEIFLNNMEKSDLLLPNPSEDNKQLQDRREKFESNNIKSISEASLSLRSVLHKSKPWSQRFIYCTTGDEEPAREQTVLSVFLAT